MFGEESTRPMMKAHRPLCEAWWWSFEVFGVCELQWLKDFSQMEWLMQHVRRKYWGTNGIHKCGSCAGDALWLSKMVIIQNTLPTDLSVVTTGKSEGYGVAIVVSWHQHHCATLGRKCSSCKTTQDFLGPVNFLPRRIPPEKIKHLIHICHWRSQTIVDAKEGNTQFEELRVCKHLNRNHLSVFLMFCLMLLRHSVMPYSLSESH